jgi:hypothetical protein
MPAPKPEENLERLQYYIFSNIKIGVVFKEGVQLKWYILSPAVLAEVR